MRRFCNAVARLVGWATAITLWLCGPGAQAQPTLAWDTVIVSPSVAEYPFGSVKLANNLFATVGVADSSYYDTVRHEVNHGFLYLTNRRGQVVRKRIRRQSPVSYGELYKPLSTRFGFDAFSTDVATVPTQPGETRWLSFDSLGNTLRERVVAGFGPTPHYWIRAVGLPGGLLTVGENSSGTVRQAEVRRFDEDGMLLWERRLGYWSYGQQLVPLLDGSYAVVAADPTQYGVVSQNQYRYDYKLYRVTASGGVLDSVWLGVANAWEGSFSAKATTDGGFLICGFESPHPYSNPRQGTLIKLDSTFQQQWKHSITTACCDGESGGEAYDAWETANGRYIIDGLGPAPGPVFVQLMLREIIAPTAPGLPPTFSWQYAYPDLPRPRSKRVVYLLYESGSPAYGFGLYTDNYWQTPSDEDFYQSRLTGLPTPAVLDYCRRPPSRPRATMTALTLDSLRFTVQQAGQTAGPRYAEITLVEWDFGDGSPPAQGWQVDHRFRTPAPVAVRLRLYNNLGCSRDSVFYPYGVPPPPNGLPEAAASAPEVSVFPNPAPDGRFVVRLAGGAPVAATADVLDATGRAVVRALPVRPAADTPLDLRAHPAGVYALRLTWPDGRTRTRRVLVSPH